MNETYYSAQDICKMFDIGPSAVAYWWNNGLPRSKQLSKEGRMKYHSSQTDLEKFIGRRLNQNDKDRVSAESD